MPNFLIRRRLPGQPSSRSENPFPQRSPTPDPDNYPAPISVPIDVNDDHGTRASIPRVRQVRLLVTAESVSLFRPIKIHLPGRPLQPAPPDDPLFLFASEGARYTVLTGWQLITNVLIIREYRTTSTGRPVEHPPPLIIVTEFSLAPPPYPVRVRNQGGESRRDRQAGTRARIIVCRSAFHR